MLFLLFILALFPTFSFAEMTKIVIEKREPFAGGHEFGVTGAYEKIVGKAYGKIAPEKQHNRSIVNLRRAPLNERGRVDYSMDVFILKPVDMKRGNQTIFYDVVNRGNQALRMNFGAERNDLSVNEHSSQPANHVKGKEYQVLVPKVDKDGNEIAGIRAVGLQVPLGTHAGWNLRAKGFVEDELCYLNGQFIPFPKTKEEREKSGDPRLSIEERYKDRAEYVQRVSQAARSLVDERFLLQEDAERLIAEAKKSNPFAERNPQ